MMVEEIILIGGGGHCESCIDVIEAEGKYKIAGIVDVPEKKNGKILGYSVIATDEDLEQLAERYENFLITLGQIDSPKRRMDIFNLLEKLNVNIPFVISPRAYVSKYAKIESGTIIMHDVLINANASIGKNCIVNSKALIEHGTAIDDHCHISTGAIVNGNSKVGKGSFVGSGSVCVELTKLPPYSFIKANSMVKNRVY